jgi:hypothetical protein
MNLLTISTTRGLGSSTSGNFPLVSLQMWYLIFDMPGDYGLQNLAIPVTPAAIEELRGMIETSQDEAFRVSDEFNVLAAKVYGDLGSPKMKTLTGWIIFNAMAPLIRPEVDYEILM